MTHLGFRSSELVLVDLPECDIFVTPSMFMLVPLADDATRSIVVSISVDFSRIVLHVYDGRYLVPAATSSTPFPWNYSDLFLDSMLSLQVRGISCPGPTIIAASVHPSTGELVIVDSIAQLSVIKISRAALAVQVLCTLATLPPVVLQLVVHQGLALLRTPQSIQLFCVKTGDTRALTLPVSVSTGCWVCTCPHVACACLSFLSFFSLFSVLLSPLTRKIGFGFYSLLIPGS